MKPAVKPPFNQNAVRPGHLILLNTGGRPRTVCSADIQEIELNSHNYINIKLEKTNFQVYSNFDLVMQAYIRARDFGEHIDLRGICSLAEKDPLHKHYREASIPQAIMDELRQRVSVFTPTPF